MTYLIKKGGKYLKGCSFVTGLGYRYSWTKYAAKAWRFKSHVAAEESSRGSGGRVVDIDGNLAP